MRASKGARRRQRRREARMREVVKNNPLEAKLRHARLVNSWHAEIWRRAQNLDAPFVWHLVARVKAKLGESDGATAALVAVQALNPVMQSSSRRR
jgi:hypothetical protein